MPLLREYVQLQQQEKQLNEAILRIEQDQGLKNELAFSAQLRALMQEFDKSVSDVIYIMDPEGSKTTVGEEPQESGTTRKKRKLKVYTNPHNGEVIETRGGNHTVLKQWKAEYGADTVEGWLNPS